MKEGIFAWSYKAVSVSEHRQGVFEHLFGYVWVFLYLSWSVPAYLYPILSRSGPEHSTVPFSIGTNSSIENVGIDFESSHFVWVDNSRRTREFF